MRKMKENACNNKNQKKNPGFLLSAVSSNSGNSRQQQPWIFFLLFPVIVERQLQPVA